MAEKYGEIPKRFTKEWWEYFWEYYKIHTIATILIIAGIATTAYQLHTQKDYDYYINYVSANQINSMAEEKINADFSSLADDKNGDGNSDCKLTQFIYSDLSVDQSHTPAIVTKLYAEFSLDTTMTYIFTYDKAEMLEGFMNDGFFKPIDSIIDTKDNNKLLVNNVAYAVSLNNCSYLKDLGIDTSNMYLAFRKYSKKNEETTEEIEMCKRIAEFLLK